jgi:hypothetical protein
VGKKGSEKWGKRKGVRERKGGKKRGKKRGLIFTFDIAFDSGEARKLWRGHYGLNLREPFTI